MKKSSDLFAGFGFAGLIFSALCLFVSRFLMSKRQGDVSNLCDILKDAFENYRDETRTLYGVRKEETVRDAAIQSRITRSQAVDIFDTTLGRTVCYDDFTRRYFYSDIEKIKQAVNRLNLDKKNYISLNDFYRELRLPAIDKGNYIGWKNGVEILYSSHMLDFDIPCFALDYTRNLQPL